MMKLQELAKLKAGDRIMFSRRFTFGNVYELTETSEGGVIIIDDGGIGHFLTGSDADFFALAN